jgi:hypothetical protein
MHGSLDQLTMIQPARRLLPALSLLALFAGCRDHSGADTSAVADSSFARDLAMAQRQVLPQTVFNDAPIGGNANASTTPKAPAPKPEPPRARVPRPTPTPRRREPPTPVARTPRAPTPAPVATEPSPTPAAKPGPAAGVIGVGSRVGMTTNGRVCTLTALVGDKFTATVTNTTVGTNGATIRAGTTVVLEVSAVERADPAQNSRIHFHVRAIDVNGESYPADGDVATLGTLETSRVSSGNEKTKVVGGAIAGAVLGRILGGGAKGTVIGAAAGAAAGTAAAKHTQSTDACLPEGSSLQLTLSRDIVVRRDGSI